MILKNNSFGKKFISDTSPAVNFINVLYIINYII